MGMVLISSHWLYWDWISAIRLCTYYRNMLLISQSTVMIGPSFVSFYLSAFSILLSLLSPPSFTLSCRTMALVLIGYVTSWKFILCCVSGFPPKEDWIILWCLCFQERWQWVVQLTHYDNRKKTSAFFVTPHLIGRVDLRMWWANYGLNEYEEVLWKVKSTGYIEVKTLHCCKNLFLSFGVLCVSFPLPPSPPWSVLSK